MKIDRFRVSGKKNLEGVVTRGLAQLGVANQYFKKEHYHHKTTMSSIYENQNTDDKNKNHFEQKSSICIRVLQFPNEPLYDVYFGTNG